MHNNEIPSIPENVILTTEQRFVVAWLTSEHNPLQVMTWMTVAEHLPYYTPEGIHSMTHDVNMKLEKTSFPGRIYFDATRKNSRGMGIIYGNPKNPNIRQNLSDRLQEVIIQETNFQAENDPGGWEHMQNVAFYFPIFITDQYPNPKPPAVIVRTPEHRGITFLTEEEKTLLRFIIEEDGYVDEVSWQRQSGGLRRLSEGIERLNRAIKKVFPKETFFSGNTFPVGYAYHGDPTIRNAKLRDLFKPQFNLLRLARSEDVHIDSRYLTMPTGNDVQVTVVPLEELQQFYKVPPLRVSEQFSLVLIVTSDQTITGTERLDISSIFMEISKAEADLIRMFGNDGVLPLKKMGLSSEKRDSMRKGFGLMLKRLKKFKYEFRDRTGIASRSKLVFPEPNTKSD